MADARCAASPFPPLPVGVLAGSAVALAARKLTAAGADRALTRLQELTGNLIGPSDIEPRNRALAAVGERLTVAGHDPPDPGRRRPWRCAG